MGKIITLSWQSFKHYIDEQVNGKSVGQKILSPIFSSNLHENIKWVLVMYPKGIDKTSEDHVALYCKMLYFDDQNTERSQDYLIKADITFTIEYSGITKHYQHPISHVFDKLHRTAGTKHFFSVSNFMRIVNDYDYNILCKIDAELSTCTSNTVIDRNHVKSVHEDFEKLMKNHDYSDVTLVVSGKQIPAHKAILSARTAAFDALFKNDLKESNENVVHIEEAEFDAMLEMLRFIYTGRAQNLDRLAYELLILADRCALDGLKEECECVLSKKITDDNAISILILADRHSADNLKKLTLNFIKSNLKLVIDSQGYTLLEQSNSYIISQILRSVAF